MRFATTLSSLTWMFLLAIGSHSAIQAQAMPDLSDPKTVTMLMDRANDAVKQNPNDARGYAARGYLYQLQKHYPEARADYTKAIELNTSGFEIYDMRAACEALMKDWDAAVTDCTKAISINPKDFCAYGNRAMAFSQKNQLSSAMQDALKALELNSKEPSFFETVGEICYKGHQYQRAMDYLNGAIARDQTMGDAFYYRGATLKAIGRQSDATKDFDRANRLGYKLGDITVRATKQ